MKKKLIAGNWKMNGSLEANDALVRAVVAGMKDAACAVAVCVPAPYLAQVQMLRHGSAGFVGSSTMPIAPRARASRRTSSCMAR